MRILAVADEESRELRSRIRSGSLPHIDLLVSCGDLHPSYLEELADGVNALLVYVNGNHVYGTMNCGICIEGIVLSHQGIRIAGLGGAMGYGPGNGLFSPREMRRRAWRLMPRILYRRGIDILVTHAPAKGWGDLEDLTHQGFDAFNDLLQRFAPRYMLHGHVHMSYGRIQREHQHPAGTRIVNACGYQIIEV